MADRYWVGGTASWDATAGTKWAATSGGAGGETVPTSADNVFFDAASGAVTVTVAATANCADLTFTGFTGTFAGTSALNVYGSLTLSTGMTRTYSGALSMLATTTGKTITSNGKTLASLTFAGVGGGWTLQDAFTPLGTITHTNGTLDTNGQSVSCGAYSNTGSATRALTLGASTFTCTVTATAWTIASATGMTLTAGTSTIRLSGNGGDFSGGGLTYYALEFTGGSTSLGSSSLISGANTFTNLKVIPGANTAILLAISATQTVTGTFTSTGNGTRYRNRVETGNFGTSRTISAAAISVQDTDFYYITGAGAAAPWALSGQNVGDCGNNSGITFPAAVSRYGVVAGNWYDTATWSATSGGSGGASVPLPQDTAYLNASSGSGTYSLNSSSSNGSVDCTGFTGTLSVASSQSFYGSLFRLSTTTTISAFSSFTFNQPLTLDTQGRSFGGGVLFFANTTLASNLVTTGIIQIRGGTFDAAGYNVTANDISNASTSNSHGITMGSGTWTLTGTGTIWSFSGSTTITRGTSTIVLSNTSATARTFTGGGKIYNNLEIGGATGTSTLTFSDGNTFNQISSTKTVAHTIRFTSGTTTTVTTWSVNGTAGNVVTIDSTTAGSRATLAKAGGGTVTVDYASIKDNTASPTSTWFANNSTDAGNNLNWIFAGANMFFTFFY